MTVRDLINAYPPCLKEVSFIHDNCVIETIDPKANGSFRAVQKHYDEKVVRFFAMGEDKIRIDSVKIAE